MTVKTLTYTMFNGRRNPFTNNSLPCSELLGKYFSEKVASATSEEEGDFYNKIFLDILCEERKGHICFIEHACVGTPMISIKVKSC